MRPIRLIVGLGNPGERYVRTRHNAGRWWVERLASQHALTLQKQAQCHGGLAKANIEALTRYILCPETFMNHSGQAVGGACHYFKLSPEEVLVVHDELDLPPGCIRFKSGGGHGGHNGLKSIQSHLGTLDFQRLRIGIGRPRGTTESYVLSPPNPEEMSAIQIAMPALDPLMASLWSGDHEALMRHLHAPKTKGAEDGI